MTVIYTVGAELPDVAITWTDSAGAVINLSTGWTFTVKVGLNGQAAEFTKTTGITGAATAPNLTIAWEAGELDNLDAGLWTCQVTARNTSSGKDRIDTFLLRINAAVT